jgi:hypothetical protein
MRMNVLIASETINCSREEQTSLDPLEALPCHT